MIDHLIDKQDVVEIIRDQVAAILAQETISQTEKAGGSSEWTFRVFKETTNIWENLPGTPVVNVFWQSSEFDLSKSDIVQRQHSTALIYVDCYASGVSYDTETGHVAGDQEAARQVQQTVRLVRNILMSANYTYLDLRGYVNRRWIDSITLFQPEDDAQNAYHVLAGRIALRVEFNEFSPQVTPVEIEGIDIEVEDNGQVIINASYQGDLNV